jgi:hypothetical protein
MAAPVQAVPLTHMLAELSSLEDLSLPLKGSSRLKVQLWKTLFSTYLCKESLGGKKQEQIFQSISVVKNFFA